ncbi:dephospho-CoA kinase [Bathymodiolus septemdierum thioautotrophic gill symbiont]|nr:dephospho-CoA kinase [Bathymodiolus septemdierum thioautotrophic gill symbiont]
MTTQRIALTGGIACGKSQFGDFLEALGADIIRLDDLSQEITTPNSEGLKELTAAFGENILRQDGCLNRKMLRNILLNSEDDKAQIERILHPKILKKMQGLQEKSKKQVVIVEIPLLFEKKLAYLFDSVIIITCDDGKQLKRLKNRANIDEKTAKQMISIQISQKNKIKIAKLMKNYTVENNGSIYDLKQQAEQLYNQLINL